MSGPAAIATRLDANDHRGAWIEMTRLGGHNPSMADCHVIARTLERVDAAAAGLTELRVAIMANVTAEPIAPILAARGITSHLAVRSYVAPFEQWTQEALDPASGLYGFDPEVVILALRLEELSPALARQYLDHSAAAIEDAIVRAADRVSAVVRALRTHSSAKILLHAMLPPPVPALGMIDAFAAAGQRPAIRRLNERIASACSDAGDSYLIDVERLVACVGLSAWHDARMTTLARLPYTPAALHTLADEYLRYLRAFTGRVRKVLVTDLDDTIWGGVVGEVGVDGLRLGSDPAGTAYLDVQRALLDLHRRGVVLAVASKNNPDDAFAALDGRPEMLLTREHFAALQINWNDKAANIVAIAGDLGLGLDSVVYLDDNPAECSRVRAACPDVFVMQLPSDVAARPDAVRRLGLFDQLTHTDDDRQRSARYSADVERRRSSGTAQSLDEFYASLEMELLVEPMSASTLDRAAELTVRTNQFNVTTRRFTPDALRACLSDSGGAAFMFRLTDRFGDHGWIGMAMVEQRGDLAVVTDLMLSCRVLKRTVETAVLKVIVDWAREHDARVVEGRFIPTRRNAPAESFYADHGFAPVEGAAEDGQMRRFQRPAAQPLSGPDFVRIRRRVAAVS